MVVQICNPSLHGLHIANPKLAYEEDVITALGSEMLDPLVGKVLREVLNCVEPEAGQAELFGDPHTPILKPDLGIGQVWEDEDKHTLTSSLTSGCEKSTSANIR